MSAIRGRGGKLYWRNPGTGLYVPSGEVLTTSGGGPDAETIDTTTLDTPVGFRRFLPGVKDAPEVTIGLHFDGLFGADANNHAALREAVEGDDPQRFRILFADDTFVTIDAIASGFSVGESNVSDKVDATFTFKPSGKPTWGNLDAMVVKGAGTEAADGVYVRDGNNLGFPKYNKPGTTGTSDAIARGPVAWFITRSSTSLYSSSEDTATPDLVTAWSVDAGSAPAPTVRKANINDF